MENTPATLQVGRLELDSNSHTDRMEPSPAATLVDYDACIPSKSNSSPADETETENKKSDSPVLSQRRKWSLLMVFCLGFFIDIWMYSGRSLPSAGDKHWQYSIFCVHWAHLYRPSCPIRAADVGYNFVCCAFSSYPNNKMGDDIWQSR